MYSQTQCQQGFCQHFGLIGLITTEFYSDSFSTKKHSLDYYHCMIWLYYCLSLLYIIAPFSTGSNRMKTRQKQAFITESISTVAMNLPGSKATRKYSTRSNSACPRVFQTIVLFSQT